jgi:hypothetical protein
VRSDHQNDRKGRIPISQRAEADYLNNGEYNGKEAQTRALVRRARSHPEIHGQEEDAGQQNREGTEAQ